LFEQEPEELLRMLNGTVEAMASLCEKIDPYTAGHHVLRQNKVLLNHTSLRHKSCY